MRDYRADRKYFEYFLSENQRDIYNIESAIRAEYRPEIFNPERYNSIVQLKMKKIKIQYSMGEKLDTLYSDFVQLVPDFCKYWNRGVYSDLLTFLSFSVLFDISQAEFLELSKAVAELRIGRKTSDWLINYLLHSKNKAIDYQNSPFIFKKKYEKYREMSECDNPEEALYTYLKGRWYNAQKGAAWWGSHKRIDRGFPIYFGYWAFEIGAIAKILNLDDTRLKSVVYYPYDFVHYRDMN